MHGAQIGPNAIMQMLGPIERRCGRVVLQELLTAAGIDRLPDMTGLIDEDPAIRLHATLRRALPCQAAEISREAGLRTAEYILANRIPAPARAILPFLPVRLSTRILANAVAKHAWTFAGSGRFRVASHRPLVLEISENPLAPAPDAEANCCYWHQAVFETLFRRLASPRTHVDEVQCCGRGDPCCAFVVFP